MTHAPALFKKLGADETTEFREAGRRAAEDAVDANEPFEVNPIHHPEFRLGALEVLTRQASYEANLVHLHGTEGT